MLASDRSRAEAAAVAIASRLGLTVDDVVVLHDSNKLTLRLLPCDVVARVAHRGQEVARFEVELARRLAAASSPVAALDPRAERRVHEQAGFAATFWTHYEPAARPEPSPAEVADALAQLHLDMRRVDIAAPHFTERVAEAKQLVANRAATPALADAERALLAAALSEAEGAVLARDAPEQLLHGEPHPGNVLDTEEGLRLIDLETCCRGPVEFDLAHVPQPVSHRYPGADRDLLGECRMLVLAMVAAWRCDREDRLPNGAHALRELLRALRDGPPWPALDAVMRRAGIP